jgi:osmotically-inducible protein OsmY
MRSICGAAALALAAACNSGYEESPAPPSSTAASPAAPRSDSAVSTAVMAKYYTDDMVRGHRLDVSAENGVVTLSGTVQSEAARDRAVALARSVDGVTQVNSQLQVQPVGASAADTTRRPPSETAGTSGREGEPVDSAWITSKIQAQYFLDSDVKPWNIDVTTTGGGVVTLEGAVHDETSKAEALRIARATEGVTRVEDRLRVGSETSAEAAPAADADHATRTDVRQPDPWITAKIQAKYFIDDDVRGRTINVETREGVVTLNGSVATEAEKRRAVALARNTDGVREVKDALRLDGSLSEGTAGGPPLPAVAQIDRPDPWVTMKIQSKYFLDTEVKGHRIDVDTRDGVVTLSGTVQTDALKSEAEQIARDTEGVKRVVNKLTVAKS